MFDYFEDATSELNPALDMADDVDGHGDMLANERRRVAIHAEEMYEENQRNA